MAHEYSGKYKKQVHAKACNEDKSVDKKDFHYMSPPQPPFKKN